MFIPYVTLGIRTTSVGLQPGGEREGERERQRERGRERERQRDRERKGEGEREEKKSGYTVQLEILALGELILID